MQSLISLSNSSSATAVARWDSPAAVHSSRVLAPRSLRLCGLGREALGARSLNSSVCSTRFTLLKLWQSKRIPSALAGNGAPSQGSFDYDWLIIGDGVGGHGAALHTVEKTETRRAGDRRLPSQRSSDSSPNAESGLQRQNKTPLSDCFSIGKGPPFLGSSSPGEMKGQSMPIFYCHLGEVLLNSQESAPSTATSVLRRHGEQI
nr:dihydrolipoyl dehydrogenase 2, chloroplastic-like [Ipomoea batatas]